MTLNELQYLFYIVAISGSLIGIVTFIITIVFGYAENKKTLRDYSKRDKIKYYSNRVNDIRLSKSIRSHATKQLKRLK